MVHNLERILRDQKSFHTVYQSEGLPIIGESEQEVGYKLSHAFQSLDRKGSPQVRTSRAQSPMAAPSVKVDSDLRLSEQLRRIAAKKEKVDARNALAKQNNTSSRAP